MTAVPTARSQASDTLALDTFETPIGAMLIVADGDGAVRAVDWDDHQERMHRLLRLHTGTAEVPRVPGSMPPMVRDALARYFAGELTALEDIPVRTGGTPFQREVWRALRSIPAGETRSYGALAAEVGRPTAVRAVGLANGSNPTGVIVPCHRVIGADGTLTGYGGGVERKRWLLQHEGAAFRG